MEQDTEWYHTPSQSHSSNPSAFTAPLETASFTALQFPTIPVHSTFFSLTHLFSTLLTVALHQITLQCSHLYSSPHTLAPSNLPVFTSTLSLPSLPIILPPSPLSLTPVVLLVTPLSASPPTHNSLILVPLRWPPLHASFMSVTYEAARAPPPRPDAVTEWWNTSAVGLTAAGDATVAYANTSAVGLTAAGDATVAYANCHTFACMLTTRQFQHGL